MPASLFDSVSTRLLADDKKLLAQTAVPIVTVSATFRDKVEAQHRHDDAIDETEVVFSRAHYSMAIALAIAAWGGTTANARKAWLIDPSNYVTRRDWGKLEISETLGRILARQPALAWLKQNIVDRYARNNKLPITSAIAGPLLEMCAGVEQPIISLHDQTGNILAGIGKKVIQVVTDPYVRAQYVEHADLATMRFCVFDENTRTEFFEVAAAHGKSVRPEQVIVTGPPIDPRIVAAGAQKSSTAWQKRPLRLLLTTGGLGTNKDELQNILNMLLPLTRAGARPLPVHLLYYAGTNLDHAAMVKRRARQAGVRLSPIEAHDAGLRLIYADDVVTANNLLIRYGFPWADIVVTKPSGDMAYDAAVAGAALLFLRPWGVWENAVESVFLQNGIARRAQSQDIITQLHSLTTRFGADPWLQTAMAATAELPLNYRRGCQNILQSWKVSP